jgi:hypothetical protein
MKLTFIFIYPHFLQFFADRKEAPGAVTPEASGFATTDPVSDLKSECRAAAILPHALTSDAPVLLFERGA